MNFHNTIKAAVVSLSVLVQAGGTEAPSDYPFPCRLERWEPGKGYSSFILAVGPVPRDLTVTATLILLREKQQLAGRIPLRLYGKADAKLGLRCGAACLSDEFVQHFAAESRIELYVQGTNDMVQTYEFPLSGAVTQPESRTADPQPQHPSPGKAGRAPRSAREHHQPGPPDTERSA
jgi:hypothetical protein